MKNKRKYYFIFDKFNQSLTYFALIATSQLTDFNDCWLIENSLFGSGGKIIVFKKKKVAKFILSLLNEPREEMTEKEKNALHEVGMPASQLATPCYIRSMKAVPGEQVCWKI